MSNRFTSMMRAAKRRLAVRRDYTALIEADDWLLKDMGISRAEAIQMRMTSSRFWRS